MLIRADLFGALGHARLLVELAHRAMKLREVLRNQVAVGVVPWSSSDTVTRIDSRRGCRRLRAEVGAPVMFARALRFRQRLTLGVRSRKTTQVCAFAKPLAGNEEARDRLGAPHRDGRWSRGFRRLRGIAALGLLALIASRKKRGCAERSPEPQRRKVGPLHFKSLLSLFLDILLRTAA